MTCKLDACNQGRRDCPCPQICGTQPPQPPKSLSFGALVWLAIVFAVVAFTYLIATRHA
jgi:hypothetical protein